MFAFEEKITYNSIHVFVHMCDHLFNIKEKIAYIWMDNIYCIYGP